MLLVVDAVINGVLCQNLMRPIDREEVAFEKLNELTGQGVQLRRAFLREDNHQVSLPVEAFDGQAVNEPLRALQEQWRELTKPLSREHSSESYSLYVRLNAHYESLLVHLEQMISRLQVRRDHLQLIRTVEVRSRLLSRIDAHLASNQRLLLKTQASRQNVQQRIRQLSDDETTG